MELVTALKNAIVLHLRPVRGYASDVGLKSFSSAGRVVPFSGYLGALWPWLGVFVHDWSKGSDRARTVKFTSSSQTIKEIRSDARPRYEDFIGIP